MALTKRLVKGSAVTATENDANLDHVIDRANHTGAQAQSTVTDLVADLALKAPLAAPAFTGAVDFTAATVAGLTLAYSGITGLPAALDAIDALTPAADRLPYYTGASAADLATLTSYARTILDDADGEAVLATIGAASFTGFFEDTLTAGGAPASALGSAIGALVDATAEVTTIATAAELWAGTAGVKIVTPAALLAAEAWVALSYAASAVVIDGSAFWNAKVTITGNSDFATISGLDGHARKVVVTASGGDRVQSASGATHLVNFTAGSVTVASGTKALFIFEADGADIYCTYAGATA